jgi:ATP-dependent exoDNAse (exonuclease V) beta subunit
VIDERPATPSVADERHLITEALNTTLVVEAAAGTGKTTELVKRAVRLLETDTAASIEQIVAVTFSEKAAGELKLRLREELERHRIRATPGTPEAQALERAVQRFEEAHVSTIHGFCADLLRERPVEARIDPSFEVLTEGQSERLFDEAFADWIQERLEDPGEGLRRALRRIRWRVMPDEEDEGPIGRVRSAALELLQWRDHPHEWTRPPGFHREREMDALLDALKTFATITDAPIDRQELLYKKTAPLRRAHKEIDQLRSRGMPDYDGWEARLCALASRVYELRTGQNKRGHYSKAVSREAACEARDMLLDGIVRFRDHADADVAALLHRELASCIEGFVARKARAGALDFLDLLIRARDLVRDVPEVRREFQTRFRFILVDEFQDTDPLQAELLWMLAAEEPPRFAGAALELPIRPGGLFIVGDPKQSIYRFRRADVGVYRRVCQRLIEGGAKRVTLQTSFRSTPHIQRAVNAAFSPLMKGDDETLQADYVALLPFRPQPTDRPSVVALPVPRPYGVSGITATAIGHSLPEAVGEFVRWLVQSSGWQLTDAHGGLRPIAAGDVCLLFRRFVDYQDDVTHAYVQALESRGLPHLLVGGKAFHEREEVDALRTAVVAIERPDDALSVFATLRGPFFAIGEEEMLAWHALGHGFRPYDVPADVPDALAPLAEALRGLADLHRKRNYCPVAETIGRLLELTRAHAGFILWRGGEQVLANVLQIQELARQYEAEGGLSFRGFVDELRAAAARSQTPEAPILEEGTEGVRIMTVHKAKGLEFPVVILADIGCKLNRAYAQRHLDSARGLAAINLAGWTPLDLSERNDLEIGRDRAEAVRLAYVAATRARDVLVIPAVGDAPFEKGWVSPLAGAIYPGGLGSSPGVTAGVPAFSGRDTVLERPRDEGPGLGTMKPGAYVFTDPVTHDPYSVVWWDPLALDRRGDERRGLRREDLITKDARKEDVEADRDRYLTWRARRDAIRERAATPSMHVMTATEWAKSFAPEPAEEAEPEAATGLPLFDTVASTLPPPRTASVTIEDASVADPRPSGRRFGVLVHALLAAAPLDASAEQLANLAALHARVLGATDAEREVAAAVVARALAHPLLRAAQAASARGGRCRREAPITIRDGDRLIDGQIDLAYEDGHGWVVVDFKTDAELGAAEEAYRRQVALYADALSRITGRPARATILRV